MRTRLPSILLLAAVLLQGSVASAFKRATQGPRAPHNGANSQAGSQYLVSIEAIVIRATNGSAGIAMPLRELPQLTHPPFSVYTQMEQVSRQTLPLGTTPVQVALPAGGSAEITSSGQMGPGRYQVTITIHMGSRTNTAQFSATPGDPFFTVRSTGPTSALVLGFIVH